MLLIYELMNQDKNHDLQPHKEAQIGEFVDLLTNQHMDFLQQSQL